MRKRTLPDLTPPVSTALLIENLSVGRDEHLSWDVEQVILKRLVNTRCCELCQAPYGQLCRVYGGVASLRRTHPIRLRLTRGERRAVVAAAVREVQARPPRGEVDEEQVA